MTTTVPGTAREPRLALGVALERTPPGFTSIADVAAALDVLAALIGDEGDPPPLEVSAAHGGGGITALTVVEDAGAPVVVSAGMEGALRSFHLDGSAGPLHVPDAHSQHSTTLLVVEHDGAPLIVSGGSDGHLVSFCLDGTPGPLRRPDAHAGGVTALGVLEHDGAPLIISGGDDGMLHSFRLDGIPGPLWKRIDMSASGVGALVVVEHDGAPLIVCGGLGGALYSCRPNGSHGPLAQRMAHEGGVTALAIAQHEGQLLIISGGADGVLRSYRLDGTPGPLEARYVHPGAIMALAVVEQDAAPLIVSGGYDGALLSFNVDGTEGPLYEHDAHPGDGYLGNLISALVIVEHDGAPLIVSGGTDGALRSWWVTYGLVALESTTAREVGVRTLSLGSLDVVLQIPPEVLAAVGTAAAGVTLMKLAKLLDAIKRVAGFRAELRLQRMDNELEELAAKVKLLDADDHLAEVRARHRRRQLQAAGWHIDRVMLTDDEDEVL